MLESSRGHLTHLAEQGLVHIRQFDQRDVGDEAKGLLNEIEQGVRAEQEDTVDADVIVLAEVETGQIFIADPFEREVRQSCGYGNQYCCPEKLGTT